MFYVYESHQGGFYTSECRLEHEFLYCEQCGDCDWEYGPFESIVEFIEDFADDICALGYEGGYGIDCIQEIFGDVTEEQIKEIVLNTRIKNRSCVACHHYYDSDSDACRDCTEQKHWQQINI